MPFHDQQLDQSQIRQGLNDSTSKLISPLEQMSTTGFGFESISAVVLRLFTKKNYFPFRHSAFDHYKSWFHHLTGVVSLFLYSLYPCWAFYWAFVDLEAKTLQRALTFRLQISWKWIWIDFKHLWAWVTSDTIFIQICPVVFILWYIQINKLAGSNT